MNLGELIQTLEKEPLCKKVKRGFGRAASYRGDYSQLAFEPEDSVDVHYMLLQARSAIGTTYRGYKGGKYTMGLETPVNIAYYGQSGESDEITEKRLAKMLADVDV